MMVFRLLIGVTALLLSGQAVTEEFPRTCPVPGEVIQWAADYCMLKLETDDEIAAADCMHEERKATFPSECAAKMHFKRAMCSLIAARGVSRQTVEQCVDDRAFMGRTVRNKGVGR